jgi:hypothetical protein
MVTHSEWPTSFEQSKQAVQAAALLNLFQRTNQKTTNYLFKTIFFTNKNI